MSLILKHFSVEDFKDVIPFSSFGARVCYTSGDLNYLLQDPRIVEKEKRAEFLSKLGNYKHFSVFAHSFVYKKVGEEDALRIGATKFKSVYNLKYPDVIGISLRHYLEELLVFSEEEYYKSFEKIAQFESEIKPLGQLENVTLLKIQTEYDGWAVFYIDKVSRNMTHQLVRHTKLNFSQRSQRYVKEDENYLIIPPSIEENPQSFELAKSLDNLTQSIYNTLVYQFKIKREDARFILPSGRRTSIVVSGTLTDIYDFIEKRDNIHAQWEIRNVAKQMRELLDSNVKKKT
ncbi:MAG: FAD-dependent thymidylate synthase [Hydrogenothermaceae bacterium]